MKFISLFFALALVVTPARGQRAVAITIDDLPYAGPSLGPDSVTVVVSRIVTALAQHDVPASGFVTGTNTVVDGQIDRRFDLLRKWRDGGTRLENHGYAHLSFETTPVREYLDDVVRGHLVADRIMRERADSVRFYRAPYNQTGPTREALDGLTAFLEDRGVRMAPFTLDHNDYMFNALYVDAISRGDGVTAKRIGEAYLAQLDSAFAFAERLAHETFGRDIPQVFLIHANHINAEYLPLMLQRLQARGYSFTSLDEAVADAAYATPDGYVGRWGINWLHRWRMALGLENQLRHEPEPPAWITEAFKTLSQR